MRSKNTRFVRSRNESAWLIPDGQERTNHALREDMRHYLDGDELDLVIVGCGAGGSTLLQRLARAGWRVAALEAGPFWDPDADWVSDELDPTTCIGPSLELSADRTPCPWDPTIRAEEWGVR